MTGADNLEFRIATGPGAGRGQPPMASGRPIRYIGAMTGESVWLLIVLGGGLAAVAWGWRRFDVRQLSVTHDRSPPEAPCWTEQISTDGRLSYGRSGCYHANLAEMEARARSGEFDTPG